jgi:hypothetical protein
VRISWIGTQQSSRPYTRNLNGASLNKHNQVLMGCYDVTQEEGVPLTQKRTPVESRVTARRVTNQEVTNGTMRATVIALDSQYGWSHGSYDPLIGLHTKTSASKGNSQCDPNCGQVDTLS